MRRFKHLLLERVRGWRLWSESFVHFPNIAHHGGLWREPVWWVLLFYKPRKHIFTIARNPFGESSVSSLHPGYLNDLSLWCFSTCKLNLLAHEAAFRHNVLSPPLINNNPDFLSLKATTHDVLLCTTGQTPHTNPACLELDGTQAH